MRIGITIFLTAAVLAGCRQRTDEMIQNLHTGVGSHLVEFTETTHNAPQVEHQTLDEGEFLIIIGNTNTVRVTESNLVVNGISHRLDAGDFVKITDGEVVIKPKDKN